MSFWSLLKLAVDWYNPDGSSVWIKALIFIVGLWGPYRWFHAHPFRYFYKDWNVDNLSFERFVKKYRNVTIILYNRGYIPAVNDNRCGRCRTVAANFVDKGKKSPRIFWYSYFQDKKCMPYTICIISITDKRMYQSHRPFAELLESLITSTSFFWKQTETSDIV